MRQLLAHVQASSRHALLFSREEKSDEGGTRGRRRCPLSVLTRSLVSFSFLRVE